MNEVRQKKNKNTLGEKVGTFLGSVLVERQECDIRQSRYQLLELKETHRNYLKQEKWEDGKKERDESGREQD
jgi:hypothetical protein